MLDNDLIVDKVKYWAIVYLLGFIVWFYFFLFASVFYFKFFIFSLFLFFGGGMMEWQIDYFCISTWFSYCLSSWLLQHVLVDDTEITTPVLLVNSVQRAHVALLHGNLVNFAAVCVHIGCCPCTVNMHHKSTK